MFNNSSIKRILVLFTVISIFITTHGVAYEGQTRERGKVSGLKPEQPQECIDILVMGHWPEIFDECFIEWFDDFVSRFPAESVSDKMEKNIYGGTPNDIFFKYETKKSQKDTGKKKKKRRKAPVTIGSSMKMGAGALGQSSSQQGQDKIMDIREQWGLHRIGYLPLSDPNSAWHMADGSEKNVVIAVIDTGFDLSHPDFPQYIWTNEDEIPDNGIDDDGNGFVDDIHGWNFVDENTDMTDYVGHGTFVAGIIAAKRDNGIGIAGINPGAEIMLLKVFGKEDKTRNLEVYRAILYAVANGAKVINISISGPGVSITEAKGIEFANQMGVFVAIASGNKGEYLGSVGPASAEDGFAVGAIDHNGKRSTISSWGPNNSILGPGELIYSLRSKDSVHKRLIKDPLNKKYFPQSGTSFSAPMAAATASLMLTINPNLGPDQIESILMGTAKKMSDVYWDDETGAGLLDATAALRAVEDTFLTMKFTNFKIVRSDRGKITHVDIFATIKGAFKDIEVGIGKGKRARKFKKVSFLTNTMQLNNDIVARIDKKDLKGSREWVVQMKVKDGDGNYKVAQSLLLLKK